MAGWLLGVFLLAQGTKQIERAHTLRANSRERAKRGCLCDDTVVNTNLRKEVGMIVVAKPMGAVSVFTNGQLHPPVNHSQGGF